MNLIQRLARSDSPKLRHPFRAAVGYALQRSGFSNRFKIARNGYELPFFQFSNVALTLWSAPEWDDPAERFAAHWLEPGGVVIDAGANIGTFTARAATCVGQNGRVHAFEPHPLTFSALKKTVQMNRFANVECHRAALSDTTGMLRISNLGRKDDCNHIVEQTFGGIDTPALTLADFIARENFTRIDFLKIDVEGYELAVLKGLGKHAGKVACMHIEVLPQTLARFGSNVSGITGWLDEAGFELFRFAKDVDNLIAIRKSANVDKSRLDLAPL
jgi:FkbM family methyltransferase